MTGRPEEPHAPTQSEESIETILGRKIQELGETVGVPDETEQAAENSEIIDIPVDLDQAELTVKDLTPALQKEIFHLFGPITTETMTLNLKDLIKQRDEIMAAQIVLDGLIQSEQANRIELRDRRTKSHDSYLRQLELFEEHRLDEDSTQLLQIISAMQAELSDLSQTKELSRRDSLKGHRIESYRHELKRRIETTQENMSFCKDVIAQLQKLSTSSDGKTAALDTVSSSA